MGAGGGAGTSVPLMGVGRAGTSAPLVAVGGGWHDCTTCMWGSHFHSNASLQ